MEWKIQKQDKDKVAELAQAIETSPVVAWVLLNRGINRPDDARKFLAPSLEHLRPGEPMAGMEAAVARIARALEQNETIAIHGDYDVDGVAGAAILIRFFRALGGSVVWHIPHRQNEGYGMRPAGVEKLHAAGASLLVTVDCGVSDFDAIARAAELGLDVIVVDHHQVPEQLPRAIAVINVHRPECPFHGEDLSGAGTAFFLTTAVRAHLRGLGRVPPDGGPNLLQSLELAALGTIADVVPLTQMNRAIAYFGLRELNQSAHPGIIQLRRVSDLLNKNVGAGQVAFRLAPRLNAAGRIGDAGRALALLLADNEKDAGLIAEELEGMNQTRQAVERRILREAEDLLAARPGSLSAPGIVAAGEDWHIGVIGIVASRLADSYHRPAAVISIRNGMGKGSLRSVPGVNIYQALKRCSRHLEQFGGHTMAAGLTIAADNLEAFAEAFSEAVTEQAPDLDYKPSLYVDAEWPLARCDQPLLEALARMAPHGIGNPEPRFCARGVKVTWAREARNNTLQMGLVEKEVVMTAVAFGMADRMPKPGDLLDVVYTPDLDTYNGKERIRVRIRDFNMISS